MVEQVKVGEIVPMSVPKDVQAEVGRLLGLQVDIANRLNATVTELLRVPERYERDDLIRGLEYVLDEFRKLSK